MLAVPREEKKNVIMHVTEMRLTRVVVCLSYNKTRGCPRFVRNIILLLLSMMFLDDVIMWSLFICEEHDLIFYFVM